MTDDLKALRESPLAPFAEEIDRLRKSLHDSEDHQKVMLRDAVSPDGQWWRVRAEKAEAALVAARTIAFEEAAQTANIYASGHPGYVADKIRTLASLPSSLVAVPVNEYESLKKYREETAEARKWEAVALAEKNRRIVHLQERGVEEGFVKVPVETLEKVRQLVFECDGVLSTRAPSVKVYNECFDALAALLPKAVKHG